MLYIISCANFTLYYIKLRILILLYVIFAGTEELAEAVYHQPHLRFPPIASIERERERERERDLRSPPTPPFPSRKRQREGERKTGGQAGGLGIRYPQISKGTGQGQKGRAKVSLSLSLPLPLSLSLSLFLSLFCPLLIPPTHTHLTSAFRLTPSPPLPLLRPSFPPPLLSPTLLSLPRSHIPPHLPLLPFPRLL